jgi:hypothetical protein
VHGNKATVTNPREADRPDPVTSRIRPSRSWIDGDPTPPCEPG